MPPTKAQAKPKLIVFISLKDAEKIAFRPLNEKRLQKKVGRVWKTVDAMKGAEVLSREVLGAEISF